MYPIGEPSDGNIGVMYSMGTGGGLPVTTGSRLVMESPENSYAERFLAISDTSGEDFTRILETQTPLDTTGSDWDVFSPTGEFLRQAAIPLGNEIRNGSCYLGGDNRLLVIRGTGPSVTGNGEEEAAEDETEIEPLEVICYRMR